MKPIVFITASLITLVAASAALAQPPGRQQPANSQPTVGRNFVDADGDGICDRYQPRRGGGMGMSRYDKATEATLNGTVEEVQPHQGRVGGTGTHLVFKTDSGLWDVHLGPTNWLADNKYEFAKGDQLEITGSRVKVDGQEAFLARELKKGGATMTLRNERGIPAWSGGRGRMR